MRPMISGSWVQAPRVDKGKAPRYVRVIGNERV